MPLLLHSLGKVMPTAKPFLSKRLYQCLLSPTFKIDKLKGRWEIVCQALSASMESPQHLLLTLANLKSLRQRTTVVSVETWILVVTHPVLSGFGPHSLTFPSLQSCVWICGAHRDLFVYATGKGFQRHSFVCVDSQLSRLVWIASCPSLCAEKTILSPIEFSWLSVENR